MDYADHPEAGSQAADLAAGAAAPASLVDSLVALMSVPGLADVLDERSRPWHLGRETFGDRLLDEDP